MFCGKDYIFAQIEQRTGLADVYRPKTNAKVSKWQRELMGVVRVLIILYENLRSNLVQIINDHQQEFDGKISEQFLSYISY